MKESLYAKIWGTTTRNKLYHDIYYNLRPRVRSKEKSCIRLIQKNLINFLIQLVYLIYARLIVHTIQILAYSKDHILHIIDMWYISEL